MGIMDFAGVEQHTNEHRCFNLQTAVTGLHQMSRDDQVRFLIDLPVAQAVEVLAEFPLKQVLKLLDRMEELGEEVLMRQLSTRLGLISSEAEPTGHYLQNSVMTHVRERVGWIIGLALMGIVSGLIISHYEDALSSLVLLAVYMPVVAAAGGNTGSQAATLVIRALATDEIKTGNWLQVMWKEFRIALVIAAVLCAVIIARVELFSDGTVLPAGIELDHIAVAIGIALAVQVVLSTVVGGVLPLLARACHLDPAVLVSPVLASVVDISGMLIYFFTVTRLLGIGG
ncbi:magnesium transporter [Spongorhabdus nitratireducens]